MNSSAKQILIGWIYRRIGFLKRGMKKQIKPLAAILRFLDFSIPRYRHFERSQEIFLALRAFLLLSQKVSPFPLSHIGRYTGVPERSRAPLEMTLRKWRFPNISFIRDVGYPFPPTVISSAARNLPCTLLFLAPFAEGFPFPAVAHTALYQCARKIPRLRFR